MEAHFDLGCGAFFYMDVSDTECQGLLRVVLLSLAAILVPPKQYFDCDMLVAEHRTSHRIALHIIVDPMIRRISILTCFLICMLHSGVRSAPWSVQWKNAIELDRDGSVIDELSGVTFVESLSAGISDFITVSDENGRMAKFRAELDAGGLVSAVVSDNYTIADTAFDTEGVVFHPDTPSSVFVSYERDTDANVVVPGVVQYDLTTGLPIQSVNLAPIWTTNGNVRSNRGFEALSRSTIGNVMWTANEEALTIDGNVADDSNGTTVRLQKMRVAGSAVTATQQFAYHVDPVHGPNPDRSGLVDLVVLPDGNVLALERSAAAATPIIENRIYQIDFSVATDISHSSYDNGLIGTNYTPVSKTLLWSGPAAGTLGANMEGLSLAGTDAAGNLALLGVVDNGGGSSGNLIVAFGLEAPTAYGDFDRDGDFDCTDIDALVAEIVAGTNAAAFDLNSDGVVDGADQTAWLADAGLARDLEGPLLVGDANLDGVVDGVDFIVWNDHKFTSTAAWCEGDFNHDGVTDGVDFIAWNANKFTSSGVAVPEPGCFVLLVTFCAFGLLDRQTRR